MDQLYEICDKHGITVVEDCAHALGVKWRGEQLGNRAKVRQYSIVDACVPLTNLCCHRSCAIWNWRACSGPTWGNRDLCCRPFPSHLYTRHPFRAPW